MEGVPTKPNFVNLEYVTSTKKDILFVWFYANEPENVDLGKRMTMLHLAAIIKSEKVLEDREKYVNLRINPDNLVEQAIYLNGFINELNIHLEEYSHYGMKASEAHGGKNKWMLRALKKNYPEIKEDYQLEEGYELANFLDLLKRGINYEAQYLSLLQQKFASVPEPIIWELSFYGL